MRSIRPRPHDGQRAPACPVGGPDLRLTFRNVEKPATPRKLRSAAAVGQEAKVPDPHEALGQGVLEEAPDELDGVEGHHPDPPAAAVVLRTERNPTVPERYQAPVRDRHPMGVPGQVLQHRLRTGERPLGVDHPRFLPDLAHQTPKAMRRRETR